MALATMRRWLAVVLLAAPAAPVLAADSGEDALLRAAELRGAEIYRADRAAWLTTDQLVAQAIVERVPGEPVGWITRQEGEVWHVAYLSRVDGQLVSFADGSVDFAAAEPLASLRENREPRPIDAVEQLQLQVRTDAGGREFLACGPRYNTVVLPTAGGGWSVYLMPSQQRPGEYPMGGFHRFNYDAEGAFVEHYAHTRSCLTQSDADLPPGSKMAGLAASHRTSPLPNELHVFMNLAYELPVMTSMSDGRAWKVDGGRIAPLGR